MLPYFIGGNMNTLFSSNQAKYRLIRTIIQGIIGVIIANLDLIIGAFHFDTGVKALIVAIVMAILSPIMAALGGDEMDKEDVPHGYFEDMEEEDDNDGE